MLLVSLVVFGTLVSPWCVLSVVNPVICLGSLPALEAARSCGLGVYTGLGSVSSCSCCVRSCSISSVRSCSVSVSCGPRCPLRSRPVLRSCALIIPFRRLVLSCPCSCSCFAVCRRLKEIRQPFSSAKLNLVLVRPKSVPSLSPWLSPTNGSRLQLTSIVLLLLRPVVLDIFNV